MDPDVDRDAGHVWPDPMYLQVVPYQDEKAGGKASSAAVATAAAAAGTPAGEASPGGPARAPPSSGWSRIPLLKRVGQLFKPDGAT